MRDPETFQEIKKLCKDHADKVDVGVPATDESIKRAEAFLQVSFPSAYVDFLKTWGTLAIGPCEFYGIAGTDFENNSVPNGIWYTQAKRNQIGLPKPLVVIFDNNGDEYYCLDTPSGRIVTWDVPTRQVVGTKANDLFEFILNVSKDWI